MGRGRRVNARGRAVVTLRAPTRTAGYPNQRAHPCAHQEHARTLTHSTDRNDAPGLAYLARTGLFKPVHMKSLSAHALGSLIIARKKTGGPASDLGESDPRSGGCVREHHPSIPVARCAQRAAIPRRHGERLKLIRSGSPELSAEVPNWQPFNSTRSIAGRQCERSGDLVRRGGMDCDQLASLSRKAGGTSRSPEEAVFRDALSRAVDRGRVPGVMIPAWGSDLPMRRQLKNRARFYSRAHHVVDQFHLS